MSKPFNGDDLLPIPVYDLISRGIATDLIESFNHLIEIGLPQIMMETFVINKEIINERSVTEADKKIKTVEVDVKVIKVDVRNPMTTSTNSKPIHLYPKTAMIDNKTYAAPIYADITITATATNHDGTKTIRTETVKEVLIVRFPIMVRSSKCNITNLTNEALINIEEDPCDIGGHFIVNGIEWIVNSTESTVYNMPKVFLNIGYKKEFARLEMLSKPGDHFENSMQIFIKILVTGQLIIIIDRSPYSTVIMPFFILLRLLGWTSDKEIVDWVSAHTDKTTVSRIVKILDDAYNAEYPGFPNAATNTDINIIKNQMLSQMIFTNARARTYRLENILNDVDRYLLPHIGETSDFRNEKAKYITQMINQLCMVALQIAPQTDRDSLKIKRAHAAGTSLAKSFKQHYGKVVVQSITQMINTTVKNNEFAKMDLVAIIRKANPASALSKGIAQAITTGNKTELKIVGGGTMVNRLTSSQDHRKNQLESGMAKRQINTAATSASNQSSRSKEMREVHPTSIGALCSIQTQDGTSVGKNKQLGIASFITVSINSDTLKFTIMKDKDLITIDDFKEGLTPALIRSGAGAVKVNGHWIGSTMNPHHFAHKYRLLRRKNVIDRFTTIYWDIDLNEVHFWVDVGRILRPFLIVYNNVDYDGTEHGEFKQWVNLTAKHIEQIISRKITVEHLVDQNVMEYLSPSEQENIMVSVDFDHLWNNRNNPLLQYQYCDIPTSILGLPALMCPLGMHSPGSRVILSTQQAKHACGMYSAAWPYRIDKDSFLHINNEMPIVSTLGNMLIPANGSNAIIAICSYSGYNQEDSIVVSRGSIERGLFNGVAFTYETAELENKDQFATPDPTTTTLKSFANYDHLIDGFPPIGSILKKNDVVIGKITKLTQPQNGMIYSDHSVVYNHSESGTVQKVIQTINGEGVRIVKVKIMIKRPVKTGDKFCLDDEHSVLTPHGWVRICDITTNDSVMSLDPSTNLTSFAKVQEALKFEYSGDMYHISTDTVDLFATAAHKMFVLDKELNSKLTPIRDIDSEVFYCSGSDQHCGVVDSAFDIDDIKLLSMVLLKFIRITDISWDRYCPEIKTIIEVMAATKQLPNLIGKVKDDDLLILVDSLLIHRYKCLANSEGSRTSANMYAMGLYCGLSVTSDIVSYSNQDYLEFSFGHRLHHVEVSDAKVEPFEGMVYCLTVPSHVFLVRRYGAAVWTGNSMRSGQKGVNGAPFPEPDMLFNKDGYSPDIIFNPHSIPSRMTPNTPLEIMMAKVAALSATTVDGTMFKSTNIEKVKKTLIAMGYSCDGTEPMYNGMTGQKIDCDIFIGPVYYQRLQKFTISTVSAINQGSTDVLTRQPVNNGKRGGLRLGEMEKNVICYNGIMRFFNSKFYESADGCSEYICRLCNNEAIVNVKDNLYKCNTCGEMADIAEVKTSWASHLLKQELAAINIGMKTILEPYTFPA